MSSAVVKGKLQHVSASQLQTFARCPRRWYFQKVVKLPDKPPGRGLLAGTAGHKRLEKWFKGETADDGPEDLAIAQGVYPEPSKALLVEHRLVGLKLRGVRVDGSIDLVIPGETPELIDHKFRSSNGWEYRAMGDELKDPKHAYGIQMLLYAAWAAIKYKTAELFHLKHVNHKTDGAPEYAVALTSVDRNVIDSALEVIGVAVPEMQAVAKTKRWEDVYGNEAACGDYGGCAYLDRCFPNGSDALDFERALRRVRVRGT